MPKLTGKEQPETAEHPQDRAARIEGERWATGAANSFCEQHADELRWLIQTWADADAEQRLAELRERFWTKSFEVRHAK